MNNEQEYIGAFDAHLLTHLPQADIYASCQSGTLPAKRIGVKDKVRMWAIRPCDAIHYAKNVWPYERPSRILGKTVVVYANGMTPSQRANAGVKADSVDVMLIGSVREVDVRLHVDNQVTFEVHVYLMKAGILVQLPPTAINTLHESREILKAAKLPNIDDLLLQAYLHVAAAD